MAIAFVLINAEIGSDTEVLESLAKIDAVKEAHMLYGVYDVIAKVQDDTLDKLKEIITQRIRRLNKVQSTLTLIAVE